MAAAACVGDGMDRARNDGVSAVDATIALFRAKQYRSVTLFQIFQSYNQLIMMKMTNIYSAAASLLIGAFAVAQAAAADVELSAAQQKAVQSALQTIKPAGGRAIAEQWSDAKKVAEILCRPAALKAFRKTDKKTDRVFLGTDDPATLSLESNEQLTGIGQVRSHGTQWKDFSFICRLDPATGKVERFVPILKKTQNQ